MRRFITAFILSAIIPAAAHPAEDTPQIKLGANLVRNNSFEQGSGWQPDNWSRLDRLTSFWHKAPPRPEKVDAESLKTANSKGPAGRYLLIDTDVLLSQYKERQEELDKNPNASPPSKIPVKPPGYNTVGGTCGVAVRSDPIPIDPEGYYNISAWCKGTWVKGADVDFMPMIFVKAYTSRGPGSRDGSTPYREREVARKYLACRPDAKKGWQYFTWRRAFAPGRLRKDVKVEYVRLIIFCYWPRHLYGFDDIKFFRVPEPPESEKSALEIDREGKHGTAVGPDDDEEWFPLSDPSQAEPPPEDQEPPEGFDALKDLIGIDP